MGIRDVSESFVARLWLESRSNGDPLWRGYIRHIQSGEGRHFRNPEEMREFAERMAGVPWGRAPSDIEDESGLTKAGRPLKGK